MNVIWRFYLDENQRWKWQQLSADRTVVAESSSGFKEYEACLASAKSKGHVYLPAQGSRVQARPHRF
jgi:hypothetical protein